MAHPRPQAPVARGVSGATLGHPEALGTTLTGRQRAQTTMTRLAPQPPWPPCAPLALAVDLGTGFHPADARDPPRAESGHQGHGSNPPSGRHDDPAVAHGLGHPSPRTAADRQCVALPASFSPRGLRGAPVKRDSAPAHHEGDHQHRRGRFHGPGNGQASCAVLGSRMQGRSPDGRSQQPRLKPRMLEQTG
jgi:hypothetical protein